jgi:hypothetical protein
LAEFALVEDINNHDQRDLKFFIFGTRCALEGEQSTKIYLMTEGNKFKPFSFFSLYLKMNIMRIVFTKYLVAIIFQLLILQKKMVGLTIKFYNNKRSHWSLNLKKLNFFYINQQHDYLSYK